MPNGIPQLQFPQTTNVASRILSALPKDKDSTGVNTAVVRLLELQEEKRSTQRKEAIEASDFALNLLSGVGSTEDLEIAKRQFVARYPQSAAKIGQILQTYDPNAIKLIQNSLRDETQKLKKQELDYEQKFGLKGFAPGTAVYKGGVRGEQVPFAPPKEPTPAYEVFEGPGGDQKYVRKGDPIPTGYTKVQGRGITIQTGPQVGKTTKTKLENMIIEGTKNIQSFRATRKLFKPEYLTIIGKGKRLTAGITDKLGLSTKGTKDFIKARSKWFRQAKADFIAYRKWATGVAGGEKELAEIATSFPDPVKNSPTQYAANLDNIEETTKRVLMLNTDFLKSGVDLEQPLSKIAPPTGTVLRFDKQGNQIR